MLPRTTSASLVRTGLIAVATLAGLALPAGAQPTPEPAPEPAPVPMPPPPTATPGVCVTIDASRDTLTDGERLAARSLVLQAFESQQLAVDGSGTACTEVYVVSNVKLGSTINVSISGPRGQRTGRATSLDDLANVYSQMVRSLVTGAPMETGGGATDRTNVTKDQSAPRRVAADSLKYIELGYGGVVAGRFAYGPAFGFGYRKELDRIGLDIALTFLMANDTDTSDGVTMALPRLMAVFYQDPIADGTMYYGGGISYGFAAGSDNGTTYVGSGMQAHVVAGYEAFRSSTIRGYVQLAGTLPFYRSEGDSQHRYTPSVALAVGIGWGKSNVTRVINE